MGFFGTFRYDDAGWDDGAERPAPGGDGRWLWVDIHDSDLTTVRYGPPGSGDGVAHIGFTPRVYFEDDAASAPTDVDRESAGLAEWWAAGRTGADRDAKRRELAAFLTDDTEDDPGLDDEHPDRADIFVEIKTARFLTALDLPLPEGLD